MVKYELPGAGSAFIGEKGTLILPHWADATLYPEEKFKDYKMPSAGGHQSLHVVGACLFGRWDDASRISIIRGR